MGSALVLRDWGSICLRSVRSLPKLAPSAVIKGTLEPCILSAASVYYTGLGHKPRDSK